MFSNEILEYIIKYLPPKDISKWVEDGYFHLFNQINKETKFRVLEKIAYDGKLDQIPIKYLDENLKTCICITVIKNHIDQFKFLWSHVEFYDDKIDILRLAIRYKHIEIIQYILDNIELKSTFITIQLLPDIIELECFARFNKLNIDVLFHEKIWNKLAKSKDNIYNHYINVMQISHPNQLQIFRNFYKYAPDDLQFSEEDKRVLIFTFSHYSNDTSNYILDWLYKYQPKLESLADFINRDLVFDDSGYMQKIIMYTANTFGKDAHTILKNRFIYHLNGWGYTFDVYKFLLELFPDKIDFKNIVLALVPGQTDAVQYLIQCNRINATTKKMYYLNQILSDDVDIKKCKNQLVKDNLYKISLHCNLINIFKTFKQIDINNLNIRRANYDMVKYILDNAQITHNLLDSLLDNENSKPFIDKILPLLDTYQTTFLYAFFPNFRPFI